MARNETLSNPQNPACYNTETYPHLQWGYAVRGDPVDLGAVRGDWKPGILVDTRRRSTLEQSERLQILHCMGRDRLQAATGWERLHLTSREAEARCTRSRMYAC
ncbi:hypothetical protein NDU88_010649 [Pleurodeles waltl]|uniref:Uncharacterized protein n=1 Tax=Pleurodeles waltl TaxID=8319 RepID=A0AAV7PVI2_PLEWA|nr:hypothetical protein NDU88_010649 [Pleurodeles waltl]